MKVFSALIGLAIGLVFCSGGTFIALETAVPTYQAWRQMQDWQPAYATLISVSGASNNTEASYQYLVSGQQYTNDRVYVTSVKDNIGQYHQQMYQRLHSLKSANQQTEIWYNPETPANQ